MAVPDLQIGGGGGGGQSFRPGDKGGGLKFFFRPFGPNFGRKVCGGWPPPPLLDPPLVLNNSFKRVRAFKIELEFGGVGF